MSVISKVRGFTLVEILVVIGIIAVLTSAIAIYSLSSSELSRNIKRQSDLTMLKNAVEQYKLSIGRYPAGCNGAGNWSGERGSPSNACSGGNPQYIVGLAPEFIPVLPRDPKRSGTGEGYAYVTNANGTAYKIMAMGTVEGGPVTIDHPFKSCDVKYFQVTPTSPVQFSGDIRQSGYCSSVYDADGGSIIQTFSSSYNTHVCYPGDPLGSPPLQGSQRFQTSYAVWGGFAPLLALPGSGNGNDPGQCLGNGWCVNPNPPNPTDDPLNSFVHSNTTPPPLQDRDRATLRVRALSGTTQIICK